ncbi:dUTP diphosphatase [Spiroplasma endosymbiont of Labia minor]|uniref:dUTP diphosphatase n=1 Tax=Spiroplasma endosymbiont of Labia minor TaxID=3066305 RepID=UPI0030D5FC9E
MIIDIEKLIYLSEQQKKLDNYIENDLNIDKTLLQTKRQIALFVEFGEFLNEVRSFKFWSKKLPSEKNIQLEEYIDGLHFIVSIGNNIHFNFSNFKYVEMTFEDNFDTATLKFLEIFVLFTKDNSLTNYQNLLNYFFAFANILKYSWKEIMNAYELKNQINYERKNNNY